jgi:hypothetical protein
MAEKGSREALTAGGARFQARKQIAASRDGLDAGPVYHPHRPPYFDGARTCKYTLHRNRTAMTRK